MDKYNILTLIATSFTGIPTFVSDRSSPKKVIPYYLRLLKKITYKRASGIIAQTELAKQVALTFAPNVNVKVIPNPIRNIHRIENVKREKIILNVGRLIESKGQEMLVRAFCKINEPTWRLVILGNGPLRDQLIEVANKMGIGDRVIFPGTVRNIDEWLFKASIFAFPSFSEGFPNALAEAMAAELPCVSFDCDAGPSDLIKSGYSGYLIKLGDVGELANKISILINDVGLRNKIGKNAALVTKQLNKESISDVYLDFCRS